MLKNAFIALCLLVLNSQGAWALVADDSAIVQAIHQNQDVNYIEAGNMVVKRLLPDDTQGLPHQKWLVRLSDNSTLELIYNTDMGAHIPLQEGQTVSAGGQLIMGDQGPLLHWLHSDPRQHRPDGYVYVNGTYYGRRPGN